MGTVLEGGRSGIGLTGDHRSHPCSLQLFPGRTTWVYCINNLLMSLSGQPVGWGRGRGQELRMRGDNVWMSLELH